MSDLVNQWRTVFFETAQQHQHTTVLKDASLKGHLGQWTTALTGVVVSSCQAMGWRASAKGHKLDLLPVQRHEYLSQDVMAFVEGEPRWAFPVAVMELENRQEVDYIAYSLWKVLCVRAELRVVFCYRRSGADTFPYGFFKWWELEPNTGRFRLI